MHKSLLDRKANHGTCHVSIIKTHGFVNYFKPALVITPMITSLVGNCTGIFVQVVLSKVVFKIMQKGTVQ